MGKSTSEELGLLQVGPGVINLLDNDVVAHAQYRPLFTGVGMLKDYQLKLHINDSVKPVAQPPRRIPFQLQEKVDCQLNELLASDIIEEVPDGPTPEVTNMRPTKEFPAAREHFGETSALDFLFPHLISVMRFLRNLLFCFLINI